jgi:hypothetical protein
VLTTWRTKHGYRNPNPSANLQPVQSNSLLGVKKRKPQVPMGLPSVHASQCFRAHKHTIAYKTKVGSVLATARLHLGRCKALQLTASLGEVERGQKAKRLNPFRTSSKKQLHSTRTDVIKFKRGQPQVSKSNLGGEVGEQRRPGARREFSCCVFGPTRWALRQATL